MVNISTFFPSSLYITNVSSTTLGDDGIHAVTSEDVPCYEANLQCQDNALYVGIGGQMNFVLNPNETFWIPHINLRDINVQNKTAGSDGTLIVVASVPNAFTENALKSGY